MSDAQEFDMDPSDRFLASISGPAAGAPAPASPEKPASQDDDDPFTGLRESLGSLEHTLRASLAQRDEPAERSDVRGDDKLSALLQHEDPEIAELARSTIETRQRLEALDRERELQLSEQHDLALKQAEEQAMKEYGFTRREVTALTGKFASMIEADPRASVLTYDEALQRILGTKVIEQRRAMVSTASQGESLPNRGPSPAQVITQSAGGGGPKGSPTIDPSLTMEQAGEVAMRDGAFARAFKR